MRLTELIENLWRLKAKLLNRWRPLKWWTRTGAVGILGANRSGFAAKQPITVLFIAVGDDE